MFGSLLGRGSAGSPPPGGFSHRQHLALPEVTCRICHATAAESRSAEDDNRPGPEACRRCHDESYRPPARQRGGGERSFRFDHERHLALGNLAPLLASAIDHGRYLGEGAPVRPLLEGTDACGACHRGVSQADQVTPAHLPRMADCLVCHTRIDPPGSCAFCHPAEAVLRPPSHTPGFADRHSSRAVAKTDCKPCHGTRFTCMGCH